MELPHGPAGIGEGPVDEGRVIFRPRGQASRRSRRLGTGAAWAPRLHSSASIPIFLIPIPRAAVEAPMAASSAAAISVPQFVPEALTPEQERALKDAIRGRLAAENAALVAHYYTDRAVQELAEETGGCVADSLEMARFGQKHPAQTLMVAGVRFMGETAKILSPEKRVLMPTLEAECSGLGLPAGGLQRLLRCPSRTAPWWCMPTPQPP